MKHAAVAKITVRIPSFIEDGQTGVLVDANDRLALTEAIERFLQAPTLVAEMQRAIEAPRGFNGYVDDLIEVYDELGCAPKARRSGMAEAPQLV